MSHIAVILESDAHGVKEACNAALTLAAAFGPATALTTLPSAAVLEACSAYGAAEIVSVGGGELAVDPELKAAALADCIRARGFTDVVAVHSAEGKDLMARLSVLLNAAYAGDCLEIDIAARTVRKSAFSGKAVATYSMPGAVALYGLRPNTCDAAPSPSSPVVTSFTSEAGAAHPVTIVETLGSEAGETDLSEAAIIVSGGRGLGDAANFSVLRGLAAKLSAGVGASRAAVDAGYAPQSMQIGQTGKTVNPNLYVACGISGAVQHYAGVKTAKVIVAVNNDRDAPIFSKCNYGIVGDLLEVVPEMTKALE